MDFAVSRVGVACESCRGGIRYLQQGRSGGRSLAGLDVGDDMVVRNNCLTRVILADDKPANWFGHMSPSVVADGALRGDRYLHLTLRARLHMRT